MSAIPRRAASARLTTGAPSTTTVPVKGVAPARAHSRDVLPAPEGPVTASIPPGGTVKLRPRTATTRPYLTSSPVTHSGPEALMTHPFRPHPDDVRRSAGSP